jgi:hypothetical protein
MHAGRAFARSLRTARRGCLAWGSAILPENINDHNQDRE